MLATEVRKTIGLHLLYMVPLASILDLLPHDLPTCLSFICPPTSEQLTSIRANPDRRIALLNAVLCTTQLRNRQTSMTVVLVFKEHE